jgi:hypothetical protein
MSVTMPAKPVIVDKWLHVEQSGYKGVIRYFANRYDAGARAQGKPTWIVLHIQQGSSWGSWQHFHQVQASSTVTIQRDGSIWRLVPEEHGPWTNGDDMFPTSTGQRLVDLPGNSNIWTLTIETEGYSYAPNPSGWAAWPKPEAQINGIVWQVMDWMRRYNIPLNNVIRHKDLNTRDKWICPGDDLFSEVINRVRALTTGTGGTVTYAQPRPIVLADGTRWDGTKDVVVNGLTFHGDIKTVKSIQAGANFRQWASRDAALTRGVAAAGEVFGVIGWVRGESVANENRWWLTKSGSRVHVLDTVERPTAPVPPPAEPDENPYDKVVNGVRFNAVSKDGKPRDIVIAKDGTPVHKYATPTSEQLRAPLKKGDKISAQFWVEGRDYQGDRRWWVTVYGSRVPVSGTVEKP